MNFNIIFLPFTVIFREVLSCDSMSAVGVDIIKFLELTSKLKTVKCKKKCVVEKTKAQGVILWVLTPTNKFG